MYPMKVIPHKALLSIIVFVLLTGSFLILYPRLFPGPVSRVYYPETARIPTPPLITDSQALEAALRDLVKLTSLSPGGRGQGEGELPDSFRHSLSDLRLRVADLRASLDHALSTLEANKAPLKKRQALKESYEKTLARVQAILKSIEKGDIQGAKVLLKSLIAPERVEITGSLPIHISTFTPSPPAAGTATPSYASTPQPQPQAMDLAGTLPLIAIDPDVTAKAKELGCQPVALYEFVKNECSFEPYWGAMKAPGETLRQRAGNDADLNALFIEMLRSCEYPAKFVQGTMELTVEKAMSLFGITPSPLVGEGEGEGALGRALTRSGIPFETVVEGGRVARVRIAHIWSEIWIDYTGYRGVAIHRGREEWIPLDVSMTGVLPFTRTTGSTLQSLNLAPKDILQGYLSGPVSLGSPLAGVEGAMREKLSLPPDQPVPLPMLQRVPEVFGLLPSTLPYKTVSVIGEYGFLPGSLIHKVHLVAKDEVGRVLMDATLSLPQVTGKRLTLGYVGANSEDEALLLQYGGIMIVPPALVNVTPVIRSQGKEITRGTQGIGLGKTHTLTIELVTPAGTERASHQLIAGTYVALGVAPGGMSFSEPTIPVDGDLEGDGPKLLFSRVVDLLHRWKVGEDEAEAMTGVRVVRPTASLAVVKNSISATMLGDVPVGLTWQGVDIDALLRTSSPIALSTGGVVAPSSSGNVVAPFMGPEEAEKNFLLLSGFQGSYLEEDVLAQGFSVESISTLKTLRIAKDRGIPVLRIDQTTAPALLPTLQVSPQVIEHIENLLAQGVVVTIPQTEFSYLAFTGTGYVALNEETGEGGYFLAGYLRGGKTVVAPTDWTDQATVDALKNADAKRSNPDPESAVTIVKFPVSDNQQGLVALPLPQPLFTLVYDQKNIPVKGAKVVYEVLSLGGKGTLRGKDCAGNDVSGLKIEVCTASNGVAQVQYEPATDINSFFTLMKIKDTDVYPTRVGVNRITATLITSKVNVILKEPFYETGLPHPAHHLTLVTGPSGYGTEQFALPASWQVRVEDQYGNWLANETMLWEVFLGDGRVMEGGGLDAMEVIRRNPSDPRQKTSLSFVTPSEGLTEVRQVLGPGGGLNELQVSLPSRPSVVPLTIDAYGIPLDPDMVSLQVGYDRINDRALAGRPLKQPIVAEMYYKDAQSTVQKISQGGGAIQSASVSYRVCAGWDVAPCATDPQYQESPSLANGGTISYLPTLLPQDGAQRVEVRADVTFASGTQDQKSFFAFIEAGTVKIVLERESPTHLRYPTGDPGLIFTLDRNLIVNVENPANWTIRAKVSQSPIDVTKPILFIPDPSTDIPPRDPPDTEFFLVGAHRTEHWFLPVITSTLGGEVKVETFTPEEMAKPLATASATAILLNIKFDEVDAAGGLVAGDIKTFTVARNTQGAVITRLRARRDPVAPSQETVAWIVTGVNGVQGYRDSGTAVVVSQDATGVTFIPTPPDPPPYQKGRNCANPGNGTCEKSNPYRYMVTVTFNGSIRVDALLTQDQKDTMRQEYADHQITVPPREEFTLKSTVRTDHYYPGSPEGFYTETQYNYLIFGQMGVAELIRADYDQALDTDPNTDYGVLLTSGYRNPERNEAFRGEINSLHQYGRALDLMAIDDTPRPYTALMVILQGVASPLVTRAFCEGTNLRTKEYGEINCDGTQGLPDHLHAQW